MQPKTMCIAHSLTFDQVSNAVDCMPRTKPSSTLPPHNVHTAKRAGARTTGSAVRGGFKSPPGVGARALHLVPGAIGAEEILASVDHGLYVQSVSGLHSGTNPVSGDFSVGAVGLVIRDGALAEPVREVTIASTLQRILHDITVVGADLTWLPGGAAGMTLLISDMSVSGA